jgi:hypothetical protein
VIWLESQLDANAAWEKDLGQVRELLLNSDPPGLPRILARNWYHLCGTIIDHSWKKKGRP